MMGWPRWFQKRLKQRASPRPVEEDPLAELREMLFADESLESAARFAASRGELTGKNAAWGFFARAADRLREHHREGAIRELQEMLVQHGDDSRFRLLAWHCLRWLGQHPDRQESARILGIIIECEQWQRPDILAVYADGTARLLCPRRGFFGFEEPSSEVKEVAQWFVQTGQALVATQPPLQGPRPAPPSGAEFRVSVLTPAGPRIQQGTWDALRSEARTAPILQAAVAVRLRLGAEADGLDEAPEKAGPGPSPPPTYGTPRH
ncbi:hypothetical protein [Pyxidicoccus xibeiensis]|uniref:hypothetical protein n=1 Tax=Pyxidicoccus xibeiensis TaxID=2906759 RepID=UPI0020A75DD8|nr:hypothetical protein [Pyxidicoccus xibeiensis]MCP3144187.1 hypothetical protein [Pyxidicoccus xibeiensis]